MQPEIGFRGEEPTAMMCSGAESTNSQRARGTPWNRCRLNVTPLKPQPGFHERVNTLFADDDDLHWRCYGNATVSRAFCPSACEHD
jgi:hypothetical protein